MNNYLKSELYRIRSRKLLYFLPFLIAAIPLFGIILVWFVGNSDPAFEYNNSGFIYKYCRLSMDSLVLVIPFITIYLFSNEYSNGTFKNSVSSGIKRKDIYISKIVIILFVLLLISIVDILIIVSAIELLILYKEPLERTLFFQDIFQSIPLFIAAFSISIMLCFTEEKIVANIVKYYLVIYIIPIFIGNFENIIDGLKPILKIFPVIRMSDNLPFSIQNITFNWAEAVLYFLISFIIGSVIFNKKEI